MTNNQQDIVLTSRVRLARNYDDLPFATNQSQGIAKVCVARTVGALSLEGINDAFELHQMNNLNKTEQAYLVESHLISRDLVNNDLAGAVLLQADKGISIMMNEEDHLRIQVVLKNQQLEEALKNAFELEDALGLHVRFAFDPQLGYLTACPTNTGTGMRASLMVHLPLLNRFKQMGNVSQTLAKVGLTIRGIYGEGSDALGNVYQISNQVTLGRTENEILEAVNAVGQQLADMERGLRLKIDKADKAALEDQAYRAYGALKYARRMSLNEFMRQWSDMRLGIVSGKLTMPLELADSLLEQAQNAHIIKWADSELSGKALDEARATRLRALLDEAT